MSTIRSDTTPRAMRPHVEWGLYLTTVFAGFAWLERRALKAKASGHTPSPTLTTTLRTWLDVDYDDREHNHSVHVVGQAAYAGLITWILVHIILPNKYKPKVREHAERLLPRQK